MPAVNAVVLHLGLSNYQQVLLQFWLRDYADDTNVEDELRVNGLFVKR